MTSPFNHPLTIGRVSVRLPDGAETDLQHWRWRTETALNRVSLNPAGMPPQALLIVRQLPDPHPGKLLEEEGWHTVNQWGNKLQGWLDDGWRVAIRPAYEAVPTNANIVWFADRAEWLACLSWDVFSGNVRQQWWWKTWLQSVFYADVGAMLYNLWQHEAQILPQTITMLVRQHGITSSALINQLAIQHITALQQAIAHEYQLPSDLSPRLLVDRLTPLLAPTKQNIIHSLPLESAAFTVLNLAIADLPTLVHRLRHELTLDHVHSVASEAQNQAQISIADAQRSTATDNPIDTQQTNRTTPEQSSKPAIQNTDTPLDAAEKSDVSQIEAIKSGETSHPNLAHDDVSTLNRQDSPTANSDNPVASGHASDAASEAIDETATQPDIERLMFAAQQGIQTGLGGIWYLVNVLVELNWLYHPDYRALNPYHKLIALARILLGDDIPPDAVWMLLTEMAGDDFPQEIALRWVKEVLPIVDDFIVARLEEPQILLDALREPAMLYITRTHVDVVFKLSQISLELRLARFDRNPAWVPELARVILLHYE